MIDKPLESIVAGDLEALVINKATERRDLEFKRDLPGRADKEVKEFLDDVVAMANAQGGDIIYGIAEDKGVADKLVGVEPKNRDEEIRGLEDRIRNCVDPRLTAHLHWVPLEADRGALIIRVPASLTFPHRRIFGGSSRFSSRNSAGIYEMDAHELRQAFTQSEQLPKRFRTLHEEAVSYASRGLNMPFAFRGGPTAVVTIAPIGLFREERDLPIDRGNAILPPPRPGVETRVDPLRTLEGVLAGRTTEQGELLAYVLTHRVGRVDGAWMRHGLMLPEMRGERLSAMLLRVQDFRVGRSRPKRQRLRWNHAVRDPAGGWGIYLFRPSS